MLHLLGCFYFLLSSSSFINLFSMLSSCRKYLVPLPACLGILCFGKCYLLLTSFCFVSLGNGIKLTDGLHGLVGGTASLAFMGMSIAVLPICPGERKHYLPKLS